MLEWISDDAHAGGGAHFGDRARDEANGWTLESGHGSVTIHVDLGQGGGDLAARREIERIVGLSRFSVGGALMAALSTACKHGGGECQLHLFAPDQLTQDLLRPILEEHPLAWSRAGVNKLGIAQLRLSTGGRLVIGGITRPSTSTWPEDDRVDDLDELDAEERDRRSRQEAQAARVAQTAAGDRLLALALDLQPPVTAYPLFRHIEEASAVCRGCGHQLSRIFGFPEPNHGGCRHWRLFQAMLDEGVTPLTAAHAVCSLLGEK
jgi:hypothetical protein